MNYIRKFESFVTKPLPIASRAALTNYYSCDECEGLWREFNKQYDNCKFCGSTEIEELSRDEWYELASEKLDPEEIKKLEKEKDDYNNQLFDLGMLKKDKKYVN